MLSIIKNLQKLSVLGIDYSSYAIYIGVFKNKSYIQNTAYKRNDLRTNNLLVKLICIYLSAQTRVRAARGRFLSSNL